MVKIQKIILAFIIYSAAFGECEFIYPQQNSELTISENFDLIVYCSSSEVFVWDHDTEDPIHGYWTSEHDTTIVNVPNRMPLGPQTLYLFKIDARVNQNTGLIENYRAYFDSVSVVVTEITSVSMRFYSIKRKDVRDKKFNILGKRVPENNKGLEFSITVPTKD